MPSLMSPKWHHNDLTLVFSDIIYISTLVGKSKIYWYIWYQKTLGWDSIYHSESIVRVSCSKCLKQYWMIKLPSLILWQQMLFLSFRFLPKELFTLFWMLFNDLRHWNFSNPIQLFFMVRLIPESPFSHWPLLLFWSSRWNVVGKSPELNSSGKHNYSCSSAILYFPNEITISVSRRYF